MQEILDKIDTYETIVKVSQRLKFGMMLLGVGRTDEGWDMLADSIEQLDDLTDHIKQKSN